MEGREGNDTQQLVSGLSYECTVDNDLNLWLKNVLCFCCYCFCLRNWFILFERNQLGNSEVLSSQKNQTGFFKKRKKYPCWGFCFEWQTLIFGRQTHCKMWPPSEAGDNLTFLSSGFSWKIRSGRVQRRLFTSKALPVRKPRSFLGGIKK